jgi:hypothetical protein
MAMSSFVYLGHWLWDNLKISTMDQLWTNVAIPHAILYWTSSINLGEKKHFDVKTIGITYMETFYPMHTSQLENSKKLCKPQCEN